MGSTQITPNNLLLCKIITHYKPLSLFIPGLSSEVRRVGGQDECIVSDSFRSEGKRGKTARRGVVVH